MEMWESIISKINEEDETKKRTLKAQSQEIIDRYLRDNKRCDRRRVLNPKRWV